MLPALISARNLFSAFPSRCRASASRLQPPRKQASAESEPPFPANFPTTEPRAGPGRCSPSDNTVSTRSGDAPPTGRPEAARIWRCPVFPFCVPRGSAPSSRKMADASPRGGRQERPGLDAPSFDGPLDDPRGGEGWIIWDQTPLEGRRWPPTRRFADSTELCTFDHFAHIRPRSGKKSRSLAEHRGSGGYLIATGRKEGCQKRGRREGAALDDPLL